MKMFYERLYRALHIGFDLLFESWSLEIREIILYRKFH